MYCSKTTSLSSVPYTVQTTTPIILRGIIHAPQSISCWGNCWLSRHQRSSFVISKPRRGKQKKASFLYRVFPKRWTIKVTSPTQQRGDHCACMRFNVCLKGTYGIKKGGSETASWHGSGASVRAVAEPGVGEQCPGSGVLAPVASLQALWWPWEEQLWGENTGLKRRCVQCSYIREIDPNQMVSVP